MSSATRPNPPAVRRAVNNSLAPAAIDQGAMERIARLGMSGRQQHLNHLWSFFTCQQYDDRTTDWNGAPHVGRLEKSVISQGGYIPPGFYSAALNELPYDFRRPSVPYHICRTIVLRFTSLLFSERRHPRMRVEGDKLTDDYANALIEVGRLWPTMVNARNYGGGMGSVAVGFQFVNGRPRFEAHDPRWCFPQFADRAELKLASLEKRYMFPIEVRDPESGLIVEVPHWYRRVITEEEDILYDHMPVGDGEEPDWDMHVSRVVQHELGFCPVVWMQNTPVDDSIDGEPDFYGIEDVSERIDALWSRATDATEKNCDPTAVIVTEAPLDSIKKGSDNALKLPPGSSANYMEMAASGQQAARELAKELRTNALEVAQCVLNHPDVANRTATEIERMFESMFSKSGGFREQYGERGVKPLISMALNAARAVTKRRVGVSAAGLPEIQRGEVTLPDKIETKPDGTVTRTPRMMGEGGELTCVWPAYVEPTPDDAGKAVSAATAAKNSGLLDDEHAVAYIAPYFNVEDQIGMIDKIRSNQIREQAELMASSMAALPEPTETEEPPIEESNAPPEAAQDDIDAELDDDVPEVTYDDEPEPGADAGPTAAERAAATAPAPATVDIPTTPDGKPVEVFAYDQVNDIVTVNEARRFKGLPTVEGGDVPLTVWKAKQVIEANKLLAAAGLNPDGTPAAGGPAPGPPPGGSGGPGTPPGAP